MGKEGEGELHIVADGEEGGYKAKLEELLPHKIVKVLDMEFRHHDLCEALRGDDCTGKCQAHLSTGKNVVNRAKSQSIILVNMNVKIIFYGPEPMAGPMSNARFIELLGLRIDAQQKILDNT